MATNDLSIRCVQKLGEIIQIAKPKAIVIPNWILTIGLTESVPYLKSATEDEWGSTGWIHAYMIGHTAFLRTHLGTNKFQDDITLKLWGFYGWNDIKVTDPHNSEHVFVKHLMDVSNAISAATKFQKIGDPNGVPEVKGHDDWQIDDFGVYNFGKQRLHVAQGTIKVAMNKLITFVPIG